MEGKATMEGIGRRWLRLALGTALALFSAVAQAQLLDSVEVTTDGTNALVRIRFNVLIQYLRHAPQNEGATIQAFFQITAAEDTIGQIVEEERRPPPNDLVPNLRVLYPSQPPVGQRRIDIVFAQPVKFRLRPVDNRTLVITVPLSDEQIAKLKPPKPEGVTLPPSRVVAPPTTDIDREAAEQMRIAREAMAAGEFEKATLAFNRVLNMPPNAYSQEAQGLIGISREREGDRARAKAEYELYLKLYPDAPDAPAIRERVAALAVAPVLAVAPPRPPQYTYWGSISQYFYGGQSNGLLTERIVTPATNATTIDTTKLTSIDQRLLVNMLDATVRYRDTNWDNRAVVREQYNANFLSGKDDENRLYALYGEAKHLPSQLFARVGRQSATSNGVLGRFDGAVGAWGFAPNWRAGAVVGTPADDVVGGSKTFYGAAVEAENLGGRWGGNVFAIRQTVGGENDRVGIGGEVRYFDPQRTLFVLLDYDPMFGAVNIGMVQGTWQPLATTTLTFLADYRRTPTLQLTNALVADPSQSLDDLMQSIGLGGTRAQAKALTPVSKVLFVGVSHQVTTQWQLGFDYRLSSLSGTPAIGVLPETPGTGNVSTYTLQAIGTNLVPKLSDILVLATSLLSGSRYDATSASIDYRFTVFCNIILEPAFRYYRQKDTLGTRLTRNTPVFKVIWRVRERFSLEAEADVERSKSTGATTDESITRTFWYIGWRWEF